MAKTVTFILGKSLSRMKGGDFRILERVCSAQDKDGNTVNINDGPRFPTGLYRQLKKAHKKRGWKVKLKWTFNLKEIPISKVTKDLLIGFELWDHQVRLLRACLNKPHGHGKSGTASGKSNVVAGLALLVLQNLGGKTLAIAGSKGTAYQLAKSIKAAVGDGIDVGFIGDGHKRIGDITVAVPDTLGRILLAASRQETLKPHDQQVLNYLQNDIELLCIDECQRVSADGAYLVAMVCNAPRKIGLSGTPLVYQRLRDLKMIGATGPRLIEIDEQELIDRGLVALTRIAVVTDPQYYPESLRDEEIKRQREKGIKFRGSIALQKYRTDYDAFFMRNKHHNKKVVIGSALWFADQKLPCLILCRRIPHFLKLKKLLAKSGVTFAAITGQTPTPERELAKKHLQSGAIKVLLATDIFSRGEDMPACRGLVLAEGVKSFENLMQRIGRAKRGKKTGINEAWVVDASPPTSRILTKQGFVRTSAYKKAGYIVREFPSFNLKLLGKFFGSDRGDSNGAGTTPRTEAQTRRKRK